jgi:hypothetical protein
MMVLVADELPKHEPVGIPAKIRPIHLVTRSRDIRREKRPFARKRFESAEETDVQEEHGQEPIPPTEIVNPSHRLAPCGVCLLDAISLKQHRCQQEANRK